VHAGIDLEPDTQRRVDLRVLQQAQLLRVMHHRAQPVVRQRGKLIGLEEPFQQHDRLLDPGLAELKALLHTGHREGVGVLECLRDPGEPVTIAVGLDHGHDLGARSACADLLKVVA
jgi:hypothetical protein